MPRPKIAFTAEELLKAATLFYTRGPGSDLDAGEQLTREQICDELNTDRRGLARRLKEARARRIVRIEFSEVGQSNLETDLARRFGLEKVMIASGNEDITTEEQLTELHRRWGVMAAAYFDELVALHPPDRPFRVGVMGGEHVHEFVNAVPAQRRHNVYVHVTALIGRAQFSSAAMHEDPIMNAGILWSHCGRLRGGHLEYATVSPYVLRQPGRKARAAVDEEIDKVRKNRAVRDVVRGMDDLDLVFGGIGVQRRSDDKQIPEALRDRLSMSVLLDPIITRDELVAQGACGDYAYCIYDDAGNGVPRKTQAKSLEDGWRYFITAGYYDKRPWGGGVPSVDFFKRMAKPGSGKKVVAFAGPYTEAATIAALKARIVNVVITYEQTARNILRRSR